jgi:glycosyltransferase involved in cell wall biosynthesis
MIAAVADSRPGDARLTRSRRAQVTIVTEAIELHDARSAAVVDTWRFLRDGTGWDVSLLTHLNEWPDLPAQVVGGLPDLLLAPQYLAADLLIYHFAFENPYIDAILVGNGRGRQAVFFHNITPVELVPKRLRPAILRSFVQLNNLRCADRLWPVSRSDSELLVEQGFDPRRIEIIPLAIDRPSMRKLADKDPSPIDVVFVGRIVPHKGVRDLIHAIHGAARHNLPPYRVRIVGNIVASDADYVAECRRLIAGFGLGRTIELIGTVDDATRDKLLHSAHILAIPSYHEGFGKPIIEGLRAGCVPVGYAAYNLKYTAEGLCRMVPAGDVGALGEGLSAAIVDVAGAIRDPAGVLRLDRGNLTAAEFAAAARIHVDQFCSERVAPLVRQAAARLLPSELSASVDGLRAGANSF